MNRSFAGVAMALLNRPATIEYSAFEAVLIHEITGNCNLLAAGPTGIRSTGSCGRGQSEACSAPAHRVTWRHTARRKRRGERMVTAEISPLSLLYERDETAWLEA